VFWAENVSPNIQYLSTSEGEEEKERLPVIKITQTYIVFVIANLLLKLAHGLYHTIPLLQQLSALQAQQCCLFSEFLRVKLGQKTTKL
jgi:hypothetical protein